MGALGVFCIYGEWGMGNLDKRRLFCCPECGVDELELCLSKRGMPMQRFVHAQRGYKLTSRQLKQLKAWLAAYAGIFQENE